MNEQPELWWPLFAECQYVNPDMFFPEKGGSTLQPKQICAGCGVREECLEYALENEERFGVWGGKSERERRTILRNRARQARERGEAPAVTGLCSAGLHPRTPENTYSSGRCRPCKIARESARQAERLAEERLRLTGSREPQPLQHDADGRFIARAASARLRESA